MTELKPTKSGGEQNLTVALRIRPMGEDEIVSGASPIAYKVENSMIVLLDPSDDPDDILRANRSREKQFVFDTTFDGPCSQESVYKATTKFLIPNVITGYNATVFAYGATGAGKTYTMLGTDSQPGIMVRTLNDLFLEMDKTSGEMTYKVTMAYLEIYNEMIRDLLNPSSGILDLREDSRGNVQVAGLSEVTAGSTEEVMKMLTKGNLERTQEPTAANKTSSRSHAILQVIVKQRNRVRNTMQEVRTGKLYLIDLAGSERAANTMNRGKRMVEGAHINRSLLALGNCINALSDKNGPRYVNYRDSKLTRLLKDALGGNCKTVMIAHISPSSLHFEESRNTLVYADRAKQIRTKVRRNVIDVSYHIAQYSNIITELREEIQRLRVKLNDQSPTPKPHGVANIQAVQSEVMGAKRESNRQEMNALKEQLFVCFKDQMELRRSLMELNNASMEISLETNRNQLLISEWEVEKARATKNRENTQVTDFGDSEMEKGSLESQSHPEEIRVAREELKVLHDEKHKTEKLRMTVKKELEVARQKTTKVEEQIPHRISNQNQQEILQLLCRVHQLEIENLEAKSISLLKDFQIKKKDMVITRFKHHRNLCDDIIKQQQQIIEEHRILLPKDLEELYEVYKLERDDKILNWEEPGTVISSKLSGIPVRQGSSLTDGSGLDNGKIFTQSAKARQIQESQTLSGVWNNYLLGGDRDIPSSLISSQQSFEDRMIISTNTRNIAALAAKKRTKVHKDILNTDKQMTRTLYRPLPDIKDEPVLTPSRLAKHNRTFTDSLVQPPSEDELSLVLSEKVSEHTEVSLPPITGLEEKYRAAVKKPTKQETELKRKKRGAKVDNNYSQQYAKIAPKKNGPSNNVANKNAGRRRAKQDKLPTSDSSTVSTPQTKTNEKKPLPTIPTYRRGDIAVTGFSLPRY
ncbi:kinesin-like protein KIF19 [Gigantopelta aegis]|uniref:kinesin-like protein KIF19 n=1 Tax=Gigantopelta aegis TaxID=1735272 RepID=UPI001B889D8C|nr:kinesin-like protein KIF19 [Gigantopelta aegis]